MTPAIELEAVVLRYHDRRVIDGLSLSVGPGEVLALLGPSGSGKTSVLRVLLGFVAPSGGAVRLGGERVSEEGRILRAPEDRGVAMVFQDLALWPHLTVAGNLAFGLKSQGLARPVRDARIDAMLERVGLGGKRDFYPAVLSGGERQRVAIARALVLEPRAVLLDEPLSNLDSPLKRELLSMFRDLFEERRVTALYVTHDLREAVAIGDRIGVLEGGRITQEGTVDDFRSRPATPFIRRLLEDDA